MHGALIRYRVMAYIVGTALLVLVFVAIPLQVWAHNKTMAEIVAPIHGYLYLVYLAAGADLARRAHWRLGRILVVVAAGFVPFVAFVVEHRITSQMNAEWAQQPVDSSSGVGVGIGGGPRPDPADSSRGGTAGSVPLPEQGTPGSDA